jgi:fibronectin type 3 domain-containing protein
MKRRSFLFLYLLFTMVICLNASSAFPGTATLSWNAPTTNADGTPLTDLAGYKVYYGTASRTYSQNIDVGNVTTYAVNNLTDGATYYFAVTAYDTSSNESAYSNEASKTITPQQYTLTVTKAGTGTGTITSSPTGINCGSVCSGAYNTGTVVTLSASPDTSSTFTGWSGGCSGSGTCSVTMDAAKTVTATFTLKTYTITASAGTGGTISPSGSVPVDHGTNKIFTISPNTNYHVADVLVDGTSAGAVTTYTFTNVTANHTISASFAADIPSPPTGLIVQ